MRSKLIVIVLSFFLVSCFSQNKNKGGCDKYDKMILGRWINFNDSNQTIAITSNTIRYYYLDTLEITNKIVMINELINCEEKISNYPPSQIRLMEIDNLMDTAIHHVLSIDANRMEWASGNHDVHWKRTHN